MTESVNIRQFIYLCGRYTLTLNYKNNKIPDVFHYLFVSIAISPQMNLPIINKTKGNMPILFGP